MMCIAFIDKIKYFGENNAIHSDLTLRVCAINLNLDGEQPDLLRNR